MKFIAPEVEVLKFNVADVLTTSTGAGEAPGTSESREAKLETFYSLIGWACTNTAADNSLDNCL